MNSAVASMSPSSSVATSVVSYLPVGSDLSTTNGTNVVGGNITNTTITLAPVFASSAVFMLIIVLVIRWRRHQTWRGVLGIPSVTMPAENASTGTRPSLWDAYVKSEKDACFDMPPTWRDMKPVSATCLFTTTCTPSSDDPSPTLTACTTRTMQTNSDNTTTTTRKDSSTAILNDTGTCLRPSMAMPPRPPRPRLHVAVLISMPSPPPPPPPAPRQKRVSLDSDCSSDYEDEKARMRSAENGSIRGCTADLSLALGIADVYISSSDDS